MRKNKTIVFYFSHFYVIFSFLFFLDYAFIQRANCVRIIQDSTLNKVFKSKGFILICKLAYACPLTKKCSVINFFSESVYLNKLIYNFNLKKNLRDIENYVDEIKMKPFNSSILFTNSFRLYLWILCA